MKQRMKTQKSTFYLIWKIQNQINKITTHPFPTINTVPIHTTQKPQQSHPYNKTLLKIAHTQLDLTH